MNMPVHSTLRKTKYKDNFLDGSDLTVVPSISFWDTSVYLAETPSKEENKKTGTPENSKKGKYVTFDVPLSTDSQIKKNTPKYETHVKVFHGGTPEEWCYHMKGMSKLIQDMGVHYTFTDEDDNNRVYDIHDQEITAAAGTTMDQAKRLHHYKQSLNLYRSTFGGRALLIFEQAVVKWDAY